MDRNKEWWVYDIETYPNLFVANFLNVLSRERKSFVIESSPSPNTYLSLKRFYLDPNNIFIGFNILGFDHPVLTKMFNHSTKIGARKIKRIADMVVSSSYNRNSDDPRLIDLYRIMHFDNAFKRTSLKAIEGVICWYNLRDLPYHHNKMLGDSEKIEVIEYCWNDVLATEAFFLQIKDKVKFNLKAKAKYGLPTHNWSEAKIGEFIVEKGYERRSGKPFKGRTFRKKIAVNEIIPDYVRSYEWYCPEIVELVNKLYSLELHVTDTGKIRLEGGETFEHSIVIQDKQYDFKVGGLHSVDRPLHLIADEDHIMLDRDVASLYPSLIINLGLFPEHLGPELLDEYKQIKDERLEAKRLKDDKSLDEKIRDEYAMTSDSLKLALNLVYGKSNSIHSALYDPKLTMSVTIAGQLSLLMLIDMSVSIGINPISANTDGVLYYLHKDQKPALDKVCEEWQKITNLILEDTFYKVFYQKDVNNYICLQTNGKIKEKGKYEVDKKVGNQVSYHKSHSMKIVPLAVREYLFNNIPIEETILSHDNIFDFFLLMRAKKAPKKGNSHFVIRKIESPEEEHFRKKFEEPSIEEINLNKTIRVLATLPKGNIPCGRLVKKYENGSEAHQYKGYLFSDFSLIEEIKEISEYDIDYDYYIKEANKLLVVKD